MHRTLTLAATSALALAFATPAFAFCSFHPLSSQLCDDARQWGGSDFNAGYRFRAGFQSKNQLLATLPPLVPGMPDPTAALAPDWAWGGVELSGHATLFGHRQPIVDGGMVAQHAHAAAWADVSLAVLGVTLYEREVDTIDINKSYTRVFATVRAGVPLGPFTISVSASASGKLGIYVGIGGGLGNLGLRPRPYVAAEISATAAIGALCGQVGIRGDMTALEASLPSRIDLYLRNGNQLHYLTEIDYELSTLDGSIALFGDLCGFSGETELTSWNGYELARQTLWSKSGYTTF